MVSEVAFKALTTFLEVPTSNIYAYQVVIVASGYSETLAAALFGSSLPHVKTNIQTADSLKGTSFHLQNPPVETNILSQAQSNSRYHVCFYNIKV